MKKYACFFILLSAIVPVNFISAQAPVTAANKFAIIPVSDAPTVGELGKLITALQLSNAQLQKKVDALQIQVNANYKVQDYVLGLLQKKTDAMSTELDAANTKIDGVAGRNPVAFTVVAGASNLADAFKPPVNYGAGTYYGSVIIDNAACNNNPNAIVMASAQRSTFYYNFPAATAVSYDKSVGKWKIFLNPDGTNNMIEGLASPTKGSSNMVAVMSYSPYQIESGDKFNVAVLK